MDTNYSINNYNLNFNGKLYKGSKKLAQSLGREAFENLTTKASETHKDTVLRLDEIAGEYVLSAFNPKLGAGQVVHTAPSSKGAKLFNTELCKVNSAKVDESIVDAKIQDMKNYVSAYPLNKWEAKMMRKDAKELFKFQKRIKVYKPFWSDLKKIAAETEQRAAMERLKRDTAIQIYKLSQIKL